MKKLLFLILPLLLLSGCGQTQSIQIKGTKTSISEHMANDVAMTFYGMEEFTKNLTDREKQVYLFAVLAGSRLGGLTSTFYITVASTTKVYTIDNFPIKDDCLDEQNCWVMFKSKLKFR